MKTKVIQKLDTLTLETAAIHLKCKNIDDLKNFCKANEIQIFYDEDSRQEVVFKIDIVLNSVTKIENK